jgi:hypothetical protein
MQPKTRNRLIFLSISAVVMIVLFILSVSGYSSRNLPPTPTTNPVITESLLVSTDMMSKDTTFTPTVSVLAPSETIVIEPTPDTAAATATAEARIIATAEAGLVNATQRARAMSNIIHVLYDEGAVTELGGVYKQIDDFTTTFNKSGYYQMHYSNYAAKYFVLRANLLWDNAGEEISYPTAGCGLVFAYQDINNHYRVFLNLDGNVRLHHMQNGEFTIASIDYVGPLKQPAGHANIILAVDAGMISVYINNQLITRYYDENIQEGDLAYAVAAGSNINYGTLCEFKEIELWTIE